jgi:trimethylamine--corrinoid protein Co-methyltransferase
MKIGFEVLSDREIGQLHEASLQVLERTGMRFASRKVLERLSALGAKVDFGERIARLPPRMIEEAIAGNQDSLRKGKRFHLLNGVTSELTDRGTIRAKVSGGCEKYLDWDTGTVRPADAESLLRLVRLGESLPEVTFVGNPLVIGRDLRGRRIDERLRRITTAALIAKNTRKLGSMEVWSEKEIDLLVEIGIIARGSREAFFESPCLVTAKETISPLFLDENASDILIALAARDLPCTVIPMPLTGMSSPATKLGNAIVGNAEILGAITAVKAFHPEALVGGGAISGILDMKTGVVSFSAPEAILQDIAMAEVHQRLYGFDFLVGSGYTDAKVPNSQVLAEKLAKFLFTWLSGRSSYSVGLIDSGAVFSDTQCLVDIELCRFIHAHFGPFGDFASCGELVDLVDSVGVQGSYTAEDHTLGHFRDTWMPRLMDRTSFASFDDSRAKDIYAAARAELGRFDSRRDFWLIEPEKAKAIDDVVERARREL